MRACILLTTERTYHQCQWRIKVFFHLFMQHVSINNKCGNATCCYMMETAADCIDQFHWVLWLVCFFSRIAILELTSSATSVKLLVTRSPKYFLSKQELFLTGIKSVQYCTNLKHLSLGQWCLVDVRIGWGWMAHVFIKIVPLLGGHIQSSISGA